MLANFGLAKAGGLFHLPADLGRIAMKGERFKRGGGIGDAADTQQIQKKLERIRLAGGA